MRNRILVLVVLLSPVLALAGWFDWGNKAEPKPGEASEIRRYVLKIPSKAAEQELVRLTGLQQSILEEMRVLLRLTEEKKAQLRQFQKGLLGAFSMDPATNYQYDPKTRTIYELIPSASAAATNRAPSGASTVPPAGFDRRLHLQLTTEQQIEQFLRLTASKKLVQDEMKVFASVIREKQLDLDGVSGLLSDKFSISKDKNYEYESATMRLYEVGTPASSAKTPASGSSSIQLRAVLPQQVAPSVGDDIQKPVPLR